MKARRPTHLLATGLLVCSSLGVAAQGSPDRGPVSAERPVRGTLLGIGQALLVAQAETMPDPNAVQAPAMLSLDEIVPLVRAVSEGEIIDAQVVDTGGSPVYEVKVLEPDGSVRVLMFDALTGSQLGGG